MSIQLPSCLAKQLFHSWKPDSYTAQAQSPSTNHTADVRIFEKYQVWGLTDFQMFKGLIPSIKTSVLRLEWCLVVTRVGFNRVSMFRTGWFSEAKVGFPKYTYWSKLFLISWAGLKLVWCNEWSVICKCCENSLSYPPE